MFGTRVVMPEEQASVKDLCYMLWTKCFDDTEQYTDYYFNNRWNNSITVLADEASMLHLNPYNTIINGKETEIYNIAGVCTLEEYRKRGYMDSVLKKALRVMYRQGKPFTYLMPASEEIYKPYGFTGIYPVRRFNGGIRLAKGANNKNIYISWNMLKNSQKADLINYTEKKLAEKFTCYTVHDESCFQALYEEMKACNGDILVFWNNSGMCMGYIVYLCEEMPEVIEGVFEKGIQSEIIAYLKGLGFPAIKIYETNFWDLDLQKIGKPENYLMARIVDLKAFAECIYTKEHKEMWLEVTDNIIDGNNGKWHIITGEKGTYCQKCRETAGNARDTKSIEHKETDKKNYIKCTIEELGKEYLGNMEYFLNELV
ncbi:MAG: GNAT family N-acetyltransferase [Lachnospiraceae bacterium]|nr:GNAT family N-acetyltransferase [Lachnospiraceae bacterium]